MIVRCASKYWTIPSIRNLAQELHKNYVRSVHTRHQLFKSYVQRKYLLSQKVCEIYD